MNLQRIIQAETAVRRIEARLSSLLEPELRAELADAAFLIAEVRFFATHMAEADEIMTTHQQADALRKAVTERLLKTCTPEAPDGRVAYATEPASQDAQPGE